MTRFYQRKKSAVTILSVLLIASTSFVFYFAAKWLGPDTGYLAGFVFYWIFWCTLVPVLFCKLPVRAFFKRGVPLFRKQYRWIIILFLATIIVPFFSHFLPGLTTKSWLLIALSVPLACIHGFFEEIFWRGMFIKVFPKEFIWAVIIPSVFFALWHVAPQFAIAGNSPWLFIATTLPLGLIYGAVAYLTGSARISAIGHSISGIFSFSGLLAPALYQILT
ncbi:MAG: CPBP family intramembrane metalloprotease [Calditrichales bacterium]|nr:MAG: CPBP family intramembrane metalloprotease [Calditrichales bacterium]